MTDVTEQDVVRGLSNMAAERALQALELAAARHGIGIHTFPSMGNEEPHKLTVTWRDTYGYIYRLHVPSAPRAGGVISRDTALRILATDKAIKAMEAVE